MTEKQKYVLRGLLDGKGYTQMAAEMGVSRQAVHEIAKAAVHIGRGRLYSRENYNHFPVLADALVESGMSKNQFTQKIGISYTMLDNMLIRGHVPGYKVLRRIADGIGVSVSRLMGEDEGE